MQACCWCGSGRLCRLIPCKRGGLSKISYCCVEAGNLRMQEWEAKMAKRRQREDWRLLAEVLQGPVREWHRVRPTLTSPIGGVVPSHV